MFLFFFSDICNPIIHYCVSLCTIRNDVYFEIRRDIRTGFFFVSFRFLFYSSAASLKIHEHLPNTRDAFELRHVFIHLTPLTKYALINTRHAHYIMYIYIIYIYGMYVWPCTTLGVYRELRSVVEHPRRRATGGVPPINSVLSISVIPTTKTIRVHVVLHFFRAREFIRFTASNVPRRDHYKNTQYVRTVS